MKEEEKPAVEGAVDEKKPEQETAADVVVEEGAVEKKEEEEEDNVRADFSCFYFWWTCTWLGDRWRDG